MKESPTFGEDAMSTIIYTSGTTGMPKGAVHGFAAFTHTAKALTQLFTPAAVALAALAWVLARL